MKNKNLIHIKFEYEAAVSSKRDILSTEMDLLKINRNLKRYREYRLRELENKILLGKKLRSLKINLTKLQNLLPEVKIPEILEGTHKKIKQELRGLKLAKKSKEQKEKLVKEEKSKDEIESQLQEIQKRLGALQR